MRPHVIALVVALCGATPADADTAVANTPGDGFLALRSEPSTKQGVRLVKIPQGMVLDVGECVRPSPNQRGCKTSHAGQTGWVLDAHVVHIKEGDGGDAETPRLISCAGVKPGWWWTMAPASPRRI